jgi:hypothetical protein
LIKAIDELSSNIKSGKSESNINIWILNLIYFDFKEEMIYAKNTDSWWWYRTYKDN